MSIFNLACEIAKEKHAGQEYGDSGKPYTYHLFKVFDTYKEIFGVENKTVGASNQTLLEEDYYEDLMGAVCMLHDIIEDTDTTADELIMLGIPHEVVHSVVLLTKEVGYDYNEYILDICMDERAWKAKISDTYHNLTESAKVGNVRRITKYTNQLQLLYKNKDH
jgi:(p)ppGpp synthase/HD superfamily hydrolase